MIEATPVPKHELERISGLSKLDLDYSALEADFEDLTKLAAKLTGAPVSLINLIDSFTQWSISSYGIALKSMPREDSVCQYTIASDNDHFEVKNLADDDRFKDKFYVSGPPEMRYYMGVPLKNDDGSYMGALCVLDTNVNELGADKVEILKIIAGAVVRRLGYLKKINNLSNDLTVAIEGHKSLVRDIREPLAGVIGILQVMIEKGKENNIDELLELISLVHKSSNTMLSVTDAVLNTEEEKRLSADQGDLLWLKEAIGTLYTPACRQKNIGLKINTPPRNEKIPFLKNKLLQILGNLVAYAIRHSYESGDITVDLTLKVNVTDNTLVMAVNYLDGNPATPINKILGEPASPDKHAANTGSQALQLVRNLVQSLQGTITVDSLAGKSTQVTISVPQSRP